MLSLMRPCHTLWFAVVLTVLGLSAGRASAQVDEGGWFDSEAASPPERPLLKIHGDGAYDPPPPDFHSEPAAPAGASSADADEAAEVDDAEAEGQRQAVREFSPHLAPYGRWVDDPYYGRIWVPASNVVGRDFAPYVSAGHWELTVDDDWLWVSDYPFGWVTFHYGRWVWAGSGWGWVPGYRYAPAWVDFRVGTAGYVGWGPAAPYRVWRNGLFVSLGVRRPLPYVFCPTTYVFAPTLHRHVIRDRHRVRSIAAQTHRYRGRRVAGVYSRTPRLVEAGIPSRAVPTRRVIARPRIGDRQGNLSRLTSRRELGAATRSGLRPRAAERRERNSTLRAPQRTFSSRGTGFERLDGRATRQPSVRSRQAPRARAVAPRVGSRAYSLEQRNRWRGNEARRARAGRSPLPRAVVAPRRSPSAWDARGRAGSPRLAAPRGKAPVLVAPAARSPRRAAPEPARARGGVEPRETKRAHRRNSERTREARPSRRARPSRGSSR